MGNCNACSGSCEKCNTCGGCGNGLELTGEEIQFLQELGQYSFLPVARRADDMTPVYLEQQEYTKEEYSLILQCLEKKGLIDLDYYSPLKGVDMAAYAGYPVHGSMALTLMGQSALDQLEKQGIH